jgi:hypothetical protein
MGNQNSLHQIPLDSSAKGLSLSAGPSPKKVSTGTKDEGSKPNANGNKVQNFGIKKIMRFKLCYSMNVFLFVLTSLKVSMQYK